MSRDVRRIGAGWVLFTALFAAQASILVLSPILPQMASDLGVSTSAAAQLRSVSGITAGVVALLLAAAGSRLRLTWLLYGGLGVLALASVASAIAPTYEVLIATHIILGFGLAGVLSGGLAASEVWAKAGESKRVLALALIGQPVAWIVGQPVVGLVAEQGWRWAWIAVPFVAACAGIVAMMLREPDIADDAEECDPIGLWREPGVRRWLVSELIAFTAWGGTLVYAGVVFIEGYGVTVGTTGVILGAGAVFYLPGNRVGRRLVERGTGTLLIGFSIAAGGMVVAYGTTNGPLWVAIGGFALSAFFAGGRTLAGAAMGLQLSNGRRLAAMSVRTSAAQFGYLLGAAIGGLLLAGWGFVGLAWGFGALFGLAGLIYLPGNMSLENARRHLRRSTMAET